MDAYSPNEQQQEDPGHDNPSDLCPSGPSAWPDHVWGPVEHASVPSHHPARQTQPAAQQSQPFAAHISAAWLAEAVAGRGGTRHVQSGSLDPGQPSWLAGSHLTIVHSAAGMHPSGAVRHSTGSLSCEGLVGTQMPAAGQRGEQWSGAPYQAAQPSNHPNAPAATAETVAAKQQLRSTIFNLQQQALMLRTMAVTPKDQQSTASCGPGSDQLVAVDEMMSQLAQCLVAVDHGDGSTPTLPVHYGDGSTPTLPVDPNQRFVRIARRTADGSGRRSGWSGAGTSPAPLSPGMMPSGGPPTFACTSYPHSQAHISGAGLFSGPSIANQSQRTGGFLDSWPNGSLLGSGALLGSGDVNYVGMSGNSGFSGHLKRQQLHDSYEVMHQSSGPMKRFNTGLEKTSGLSSGMGPGPQELWPNLPMSGPSFLGAHDVWSGKPPTLVRQSMDGTRPCMTLPGQGMSPLLSFAPGHTMTPEPPASSEPPADPLSGKSSDIKLLPRAHAVRKRSLIAQTGGTGKASSPGAEPRSTSPGARVPGSGPLPPAVPGEELGRSGSGRLMQGRHSITHSTNNAIDPLSGGGGGALGTKNRMTSNDMRLVQMEAQVVQQRTSTAGGQRSSRTSAGPYAAFPGHLFDGTLLGAVPRRVNSMNGVDKNNNNNNNSGKSSGSGTEPQLTVSLAGTRMNQGQGTMLDVPPAADMDADRSTVDISGLTDESDLVIKNARRPSYVHALQQLAAAKARAASVAAQLAGGGLAPRPQPVQMPQAHDYRSMHPAGLFGGAAGLGGASPYPPGMAPGASSSMGPWNGMGWGVAPGAAPQGPGAVPLGWQGTTGFLGLPNDLALPSDGWGAPVPAQPLLSPPMRTGSDDLGLREGMQRLLIQDPNSGMSGGQQLHMQGPASGMSGGLQLHMQGPASGMPGGQQLHMQGPVSGMSGGQHLHMQGPPNGMSGGLQLHMQGPTSGMSGGLQLLAQDSNSGRLGTHQLPMQNSNSGTITAPHLGSPQLPLHQAPPAQQQGSSAWHPRPSSPSLTFADRMGFAPAVHAVATLPAWTGAWAGSGQQGNASNNATATQQQGDSSAGVLRKLFAGVRGDGGADGVQLLNTLLDSKDFEQDDPASFLDFLGGVQPMSTGTATNPLPCPKYQPAHPVAMRTTIPLTWGSWRPSWPSNRLQPTNCHRPTNTPTKLGQGRSVCGT